MKSVQLTQLQKKKESLPGLVESDLDVMGITLAGHRNRIMKNLPGGGAVAASTDRRSRLNTGDDFGLNAVLGCLTTMKYELEDAVKIKTGL